MNRAAKRLFDITNYSRLENLGDALVKVISEMKSEEKRVVRYTRNQEVLQLVVSLTEFKLQQEAYQLVSFQNIRNELQKSEVDAWQKLIRVLTHEIMNSVTPVSTLADTLQKILFDPDTQAFRGEKLSNEQAADTQHALQLIKKRSEGLMNFVQTYRNLTLLPKPDLEPIQIQQLFGDLQRLFRKRCEKEGIQFEVHCKPDDLTCIADPQLLEQVLINLIINAIDALAIRVEKRLSLHAWLNAMDQVEIIVEDNGMGISPEQIDEIFIPFYSTKDHGTGIGLSISRQIMQAHGGSLQVISQEGEGSRFVLGF